MTAQIHDEFMLNGQDYSIVGVNGRALFEPQKYELEPESRCSACWRGFYCKYALVNNGLVLDTLHISFSSRVPLKLTITAPELFGIKPKKTEDNFSWFDYYYSDLKLPVSFTGGLLIADGFIEELYVHMGFHPAWKYKKVYELLFQDGVNIELRDISQKIEVIRAKMREQPLEPGDDAKLKDLEKWISTCFSLDYDF